MWICQLANGHEERDLHSKLIHNLKTGVNNKAAFFSLSYQFKLILNEHSADRRH